MPSTLENEKPKYALVLKSSSLVSAALWVKKVVEAEILQFSTRLHSKCRTEIPTKSERQLPVFDSKNMGT